MTTRKAEQSSRFINRELSWLEFNQRVLDEAMTPENPLLERIKFLSITGSNLDEFFEVRVAGLKQQIESRVVERGLDGRTATETFRAIRQRVARMVEDQSRTWNEQLQPGLARHHIRFLRINDLNPRRRKAVQTYYEDHLRPVLTPLGLDPSHPFPELLNKTVNLIISLEVPGNSGQPQYRRAIVQVPRAQSRLFRLPDEETALEFVLLEDMIGYFLEDLFPGTRILGYWSFRVTRNSELYIDEEEVANVLSAVENELHRRRKGVAVRLELHPECPREIRSHLLNTLNLSEEDLYLIDAPLNPQGLMALYEGDHSPELRDPPFKPPMPIELKSRSSYFAAIRARDILLHHPYDSFESVIGFLEEAAEDPDVLAIKQTLYRNGGDSRIVQALMRAVHNDKQVTAVVELKARFDEANNIVWARRLEEAGVHVVYGLIGYKIHGKVCLVVRHEESRIRRYIHLSTGNYNPTTARLYTDLGLMTCEPDFGEDATNLFNLLTGICQFPGMRRFLIAPFDLHRKVLEDIHQEKKNAEQGLPARIIAKMNALVDKDVIDALYDASQAGVRIELIVRGICCLRPQVKGLSEHIRVISIVDRFLEHSRIFYFENACRPKVFLGSADWMPRNFQRRIEIVFPIQDGNLRDRIINELLAISWSDNVKAREIDPDGGYRQRAPGPDEAPARSQVTFMNLALKRAEEGMAPTTQQGAYPQVTPRLSPFQGDSVRRDGPP